MIALLEGDAPHLLGAGIPVVAVRVGGGRGTPGETNLPGWNQTIWERLLVE